MIKLFEEYNNYYVEIPVDDSGIVSLPNSDIKRINFNLNTIVELKSILKGFSFDKCDSKLSFHQGNMNVRYSPISGTIHRFDDDWFILCINNKKGAKHWHWYKCDQLEGLKKCILHIIQSK